jgi:hypothetical protein
VSSTDDLVLAAAWMSLANGDRWSVTGALPAPTAQAPTFAADVSSISSENPRPPIETRVRYPASLTPWRMAADGAELVANAERDPAVA